MTKLKFVSSGVLVTALVLSAFPAMATVISWLAPSNLSVAGQSAEDVQVVSSNGRAVAAWERNNGTDDIIQASTSLNGGPWSTDAVDISLILHNSNDVQLAVNSSNLFIAVWEGDVDDTRTADVIWFSTSSDGVNWLAPLALSSDTAGQDADDPQVVVDSEGLITVAWEFGDVTDDIIQSRSSLDGITWSPVADLSDPQEQGINVQLTVSPAGLFTAIWETSAGGNDRIHSSSSSDGVTWSAPAYVSGVPSSWQDAYDPQVTVNSDGFIMVVWEFYNGATNIIQSGYSQDGISWSLANLSSTPGWSKNPQLTVNASGLFTVIWEMYDGDDDIVQVSSSSNGTTWSAVENLSGGGQSLGDVQLTVNSAGLFVAVWAGDKSAQDSDDVIWWSSSSGGLNWSAPLPVYASDDTLDADNPQVTADSSSGRVTAAWERDPDANTSSDIIQSSHITLAGGQTQGPTTLAVTGADFQWLTFGSLTSIVAGAGFLAFSRRKRTA